MAAVAWRVGWSGPGRAAGVARAVGPGVAADRTGPDRVGGLICARRFRPGGGRGADPGVLPAGNWWSARHARWDRAAPTVRAWSWCGASAQARGVALRGRSVVEACGRRRRFVARRRWVGVPVGRPARPQRAEGSLLGGVDRLSQRPGSAELQGAEPLEIAPRGGPRGGPAGVPGGPGGVLGGRSGGGVGGGDIGGPSGVGGAGGAGGGVGGADGGIGPGGGGLGVVGVDPVGIGGGLGRSGAGGIDGAGGGAGGVGGAGGGAGGADGLAPPRESLGAGDRVLDLDLAILGQDVAQGLDPAAQRTAKATMARRGSSVNWSWRSSLLMAVGSLRPQSVTSLSRMIPGAWTRVNRDASGPRCRRPACRPLQHQGAACRNLR